MVVTTVTILIENISILKTLYAYKEAVTYFIRAILLVVTSTV